MKRKVLSVGQCMADHGSIRRLIETSFDAELVAAHSLDDALAQLRQEPFALVLVNRKLDADYSDGLEVIRAIKQDDALKGVPTMMVTNYAEHQQTAIAAGAEPGFGKSQLTMPQTAESLGRFLDRR